MEELEKTPLVYKYLLVGPAGTGKSSFLQRYVNDAFDEKYLATIGVDFAIKMVSLDNGKEAKA